MPHIAIISSSVRTGRNSHRVALFFQNYLTENKLATAEIIDLKSYQFPLFDERLRLLPDPSDSLLDYAKRVKAADGIILVTPEYNGGYPASIKNAVDVLYAEWRRKPIAISTVSDGIFGGTQVITSLQFSLWKIKSWTVPAMFPVPKVQDSFNEKGVPADKEGVEKRAKAFVEELLWCVEANRRMKEG
jgi:NAD(P)H-dependent FMN reductase